MSAGPLVLFPACPLPGCDNLTDDGEPCGECAALIAEGFIRPPEQPMTLDDARRVLAGQAAAQQLATAERTAAQDRGELYKPGQRCWVCEQRRACRPDPDQRGEWICRECEAIQL